MSSLLGFTQLKVKLFYDDMELAEPAVNDFLQEHDGDIVNVEINSAEHRRFKVAVLYRDTSERKEI